VKIYQNFWYNVVPLWIDSFGNEFVSEIEGSFTDRDNDVRITLSGSHKVIVLGQQVSALDDLQWEEATRLRQVVDLWRQALHAFERQVNMKPEEESTPV